MIALGYDKVRQPVRPDGWMPLSVTIGPYKAKLSVLAFWYAFALSQASHVTSAF